MVFHPVYYGYGHKTVTMFEKYLHRSTLLLDKLLRGMAMAGKIKQRWYSGWDIIVMGIQGFELLSACEGGLLTAYNKDTGLEISNLQMIKNYCTINDAKNFVYKADEVEAFLKQLTHETENDSAANDQLNDVLLQPSLDLESKMKEARIRGGRASKINKPIMEAIKEFIRQKQSIEEGAGTIARKFKNKYKDSDTSCTIKIDSGEYEIYCDGNKIVSSCSSSNRDKYHGKSIEYSTFLSRYIPEAKKELESSKNNNT